MVEQLLALTRSELAWLRALGFAESGSRRLKSRFSLEYSGPHGVVEVGVDLGRGGELDIFVRPPQSPAHVPLNAMRATHDLPAVDTVVDSSTITSARRGLISALHGLRALADRELAGDWARFERARGIARSQRAHALERALSRTENPDQRAALERRLEDLGPR